MSISDVGNFLIDNPLTRVLSKGLSGISGRTDDTPNQATPKEALGIAFATVGIGMLFACPPAGVAIGLLALIGGVGVHSTGDKEPNKNSGSNSNSSNPALPTSSQQPTIPFSSQVPPTSTTVPATPIKAPNERFYYFGDSQAGALHGNNEGSQPTFHFNDNGRSRVGADPKAILEEMSRFLGDPNNVSAFKGKIMILSPGADNTNTDSTNTYKQMAALLRENNIPYIIIPPGNTNAKNQHLESLTTAFGAENILNTSSVSVSKIDNTHYDPHQLQQAINSHIENLETLT